MMWWDGPGFGLWHPFLTIGVIFLGVVLIIVVSRLLPARPPRNGEARPAALEILRQRFARGEIDRAEFEERRKLLQET